MNVLNSKDTSFGMSGLCGLAVTNDNKYMFVINAGNGSIVKIDISSVVFSQLPITAPTASNVTSIVIPSSYTSSLGGRFRPTTLKSFGDDIYIGGQNDTIGTLNNNFNFTILKYNYKSQIFSLVYQYSPPSTFTTGNLHKGSIAISRWNARYQGNLTAANLTKLQASFSNIEFDDFGALVLGFRDRTVFSDSSFYQTGFFIRLHKINGSNYQMESNGASVPYNHPFGISNTNGPDSNWFFLQSLNVAGVHPNVFSSGLLNIPGKNLLVGCVDPYCLNTFGTRYYSIKTGKPEYGVSIGGAKNSVMSDLQAICDPNPIEIGNRVWKDVNGNGYQDGDEPSLVGVTVCLYDAANTQISTAVTDADGNYIFSSAAGTSTTSVKYGLTLTNGANYSLRICSLGSDASVTGLSLSNVSPAPGETSGQPNSKTTLANNDAFLVSGVPRIDFVMGSPGENIHNYDFGFSAAPPCPVPNCGTGTSIKN